MEFSVKDGKMLLEPFRLSGENPSREAEMLAAMEQAENPITLVSTLDITSQIVISYEIEVSHCF